LVKKTSKRAKLLQGQLEGVRSFCTHRQRKEPRGAKFSSSHLLVKKKSRRAKFMFGHAKLAPWQIKHLVYKVYKYGAKKIVKEFATLLSITQ
jgi:hypothetical protein